MKIMTGIILLCGGSLFGASQGWSQALKCENYVVLIKLEQMNSQNQNTTMDPRLQIGSNLDVALGILHSPLFETIDEETIGRRMIGLFKPVGMSQDVLNAVNRLRLIKGLSMDCEIDQYRPQPRLTGGN